MGWPRITNSRELSLRRLESKSSRLCSKNLVSGERQYTVKYKNPSWGRSWKNWWSCCVQWVGRENYCSGFENTWRSSFYSVCSLICRLMQLYPVDVISEITYCCTHNMVLNPDVPNDFFPWPFNGSLNLAVASSKSEPLFSIRAIQIVFIYNYTV